MTGYEDPRTKTDWIQNGGYTHLSPHNHHTNIPFLMKRPSESSSTSALETENKARHAQRAKYHFSHQPLPENQCDICNKRFSRPSALKTHMYVHTGERPHICTFPGCKSKFTALSNLRRHLKLHSTSSTKEITFVNLVQETKFNKEKVKFPKKHPLVSHKALVPRMGKECIQLYGNANASAAMVTITSPKAIGFDGSTIIKELDERNIDSSFFCPLPSSYATASDTMFDWQA